MSRIQWVTDRTVWELGRLQWVTDRTVWELGRIQWVTDRTADRTVCVGKITVGN